jgi:hypothetical protein
MDVFGLSLPDWRGRLIPLMIAVAAIAGAPQASYARSTSTQLLATLTILPSCSFSSFGAQNENSAGRFPGVKCTSGAAPHITYSRERLPTNTNASLPKTQGGAVQSDTDKRADVTVITLYLF